MEAWLAVAVIAFALLIVGLGVFYTQYRRGEVQRADVVAAVVLIAVALLLVVLSELVAQEISGAIFFLWLPFWLYWYNRRRGRQV